MVIGVHNQNYRLLYKFAGFQTILPISDLTTVQNGHLVYCHFVSDSRITPIKNSAPGRRRNRVPCAACPAGPGEPQGYLQSHRRLPGHQSAAAAPPRTSHARETSQQQHHLRPTRASHPRDAKPRPEKSGSTSWHALPPPSSSPSPVTVGMSSQDLLCKKRNCETSRGYS
jgi:hypothetical protein